MSEKTLFILNADLVVADFTDLNPNALYELGIRHSTLKPVIHIAKAGTALPFDTERVNDFETVGISI